MIAVGPGFRPFFVTLLGAALLTAAGACGSSSSTQTPDGGINENPVNCTADYIERLDQVNSPALAGGGSENSELALGSVQTTTICGELNPAFPVDPAVDADFFSFNVDADPGLDARVELSLAGLSPDQSARVELWSSRLALLAAAPVVNGIALLERPGLPADRYLVSVTLDGAAPAAPLPYAVTLTLDSDPCDSQAPPNYSEMGDGADNLGNDVVAIEFAPLLSATRAGGTPEATGLTLTAGVPIRFTGAATAGDNRADDYRDRDTFAVTIAPGTTELEGRLSWTRAPGDPDLDFFLFPADQLDRELTAGAGSLVLVDADERFTIRLPQTGPHWLVVGAAVPEDDIEEPTANYTVTLCPR